MSIAKQEQFIVEEVNESGAIMYTEHDDLPDLICEECNCVVGWDNICLCDEE